MRAKILSIRNLTPPPTPHHHHCSIDDLQLIICFLIVFKANTTFVSLYEWIIWLTSSVECFTWLLESGLASLATIFDQGQDLLSAHHFFVAQLLEKSSSKQATTFGKRWCKDEVWYVDLCNGLNVKLNRTSSMSKSVLSYELDKGQYLGLETPFTQSCSSQIKRLMIDES